MESNDTTDNQKDEAKTAKAPTMKALAAEQLAAAEEMATIKASMDEQSRQAAAINGKMDNILNALEGMSSKHHPTGPTQMYDDALNHDLGGSQHDANFSERGPLALEKPNVMDVDDPDFRRHQDELRFMSEMIDVLFQESSEASAPPSFQVHHNGRPYYFQAGKSYVIPRAVVAILCDARPIAYASEEFTDRDGVKKVRYPAKRGLRYPFSVLNDPNPRGGEWLRRSLSAA